MGHRLSKIYTRTGDQGSTGLGNGQRTSKDSPRVEAMGTVDELNSLIGLLLSHPLDAAIGEYLTAVQHDLFDLGGELAVPGHTLIQAADVTRLEQYLDTLNADLPPLREFILPGGSAAAAVAHLARAVCRRAERCLVSLARSEDVGDDALAYVNRLSDLLFVIARVVARADGGSEVLWQREHRK